MSKRTGVLLFGGLVVGLVALGGLACGGPGDDVEPRTGSQLGESAAAGAESTASGPAEGSAPTGPSGIPSGVEDDSEAEETPLLTAEGGEPTGPFETPSGVEDDSQTEETPLVTAEPVAGGQSEEALSKPAPADDGSASEGAAAAPAEHGTAGSARRSLEIIDILPKDRILAVFDPTFLTVEEAEGQMMNPGELVIGLSIDGDSRAYPVPFLSSREIVNDVVGGKPVAVTW